MTLSCRLEVSNSFNAAQPAWLESPVELLLEPDYNKAKSDVCITAIINFIYLQQIGAAIGLLSPGTVKLVPEMIQNGQCHSLGRYTVKEYEE